MRSTIFASFRGQKVKKMIIELPNFVDLETTSMLKERVRPFLKNKQDNYGTHRDGSGVNITLNEELKDVDETLHTPVKDNEVGLENAKLARLEPVCRLFLQNSNNPFFRVDESILADQAVD